MDCVIQGDLLWPDGQIRPGALAVQGSRIGHLASDPAELPPGLPARVAPAGSIIAPGFIDLQINGAFGHDLTSHPHQIIAVARSLPRFGVTSFLPTIVSAPLMQYLDAAAAVKELAAEEGTARVLGLHFVGPYLATSRPGAHSVPFLRRPALEELMYIDQTVVRLVTVAPELPGMATFIKALVALGITVGLGYSDASYEQTMAAIDQGASWSPHVFNAMAGLHHRHPGIAGAVLTDERVRLGVVADGVHLHPAMIRLVVAAKGPGGVTLTSDSVAATGMLGRGDFTLGQQKLVVDNHASRLPGGVLAGGLTMLDQALRTMVQTVQIPLAQALQMASANPAAVISEEKLGVLRPGARADVIILDPELEVAWTMIGGEVAYRREESPLLGPAGSG
jgi:N-acetylglucosamine-6-phosphate deacetylase